MKNLRIVLSVFAFALATVAAFAFNENVANNARRNVTNCPAVEASITGCEIRTDGNLCLFSGSELKHIDDTSCSGNSYRTPPTP